MQNAVYFGAKRKAFWCKTRCILVLNARQNDAKCETKSINIHRNGIDKTLLNHEIYGAKWAKNTLKSAFLVAKCRKTGSKNSELATNLERLNGAKRRLCS